VHRADVGLVVEIGARERLLIAANSGELRSGSSGMAASMIFKVSDLAGLSVGRRRVTRDSLRARVGQRNAVGGQEPFVTML
jgi:hypothetical protein